ncbi:MAG: immunoglobulin-like domain-containing protein, partial [Woeseiaceae bacterium]
MNDFSAPPTPSWHQGLCIRSSLAAILLSVLAFAHPAFATNPIAVDDTPVVGEDSGPNIINVAGNDSDPDDGLNVNSAAVFGGQPANGTAVGNGNGTITYTPDLNYFGPDSFQYQICNLIAECSVANVNVTVSADNDQAVITVNGANTVNLAVGQTYTELGATATDVEDGTQAASVGGDTVNTAVAATYIVTYNYTDNGGLAAAQVTRTVNVSDSNPPVISLTGPASVTIDVGESYVELGATAIDPEEGSVAVIIDSGAVNENVAGSYPVTYNASDTTGNNAVEVIRTVNVNAPPTITITGDNPATVTQGEVYADEGATASDLEDGDISGNIQTVNLVDTSTPGPYTVTYTVTDSAGSQAQAIRNVTVGANVAPIINAQVAVLTTAEETQLELLLANFTITDPDSINPDDLTLIVQDGIDYTHVGNFVTPALDFNGNLTVPVVVNDGFTDSTPFNATVSVTAVNDQPAIAGQQPLSVLEDTSITVLLTNLVIDDPDSTNFTLTLLPGVNHTVVGAVVTPAANFNGNLSVPATVTDDSGELNATSAQFNLSITVDSVNDLPVIVAPIADQN